MMILDWCSCIAHWLSKMQDQKSLTLHWSSFLEGGSDIVSTISANKFGEHVDYSLTSLHISLIMDDARIKIVDTLLMLIFRRV